MGRPCTFLSCNAFAVYLQEMDGNANGPDSAPVSPRLWRAVVATLAAVIGSGLAAALWLGTRPAVPGALEPSSAQALGAWTLGPGASGGEGGGRFTLRADARQASRVAFATSELMLTDFSVEVRAALLDGPDDAGYGLVVRQRELDEFVTLLIGADGYIAVGQMSGGTWRWRVPWQQWPHIRRGASENILRAQCYADRCRFFVNAEFAFEVDGIPAQGRVGPAVWRPVEGSSPAALFQEWRVWK